MTPRYDVPEILLVEDSPADAELTLRALRKANLANHILWLKDGQEALDFLFQEGPYTGAAGARPARHAVRAQHRRRAWLGRSRQAR